MKAEIALLGNPNCGKTTLFNELTGDNKTVGNWTGVTVTLEIGHFHYNEQAFDVVDLPGIYSLFTHSPEQITACEYLVNYHPDVLVNIVDSTNLERNLYLTTQLVETGVPVVVALNMEDELLRQGLSLDAKALSEQLGVPCVKISATRRRGIDKLMQTVMDVALHPYRGRPAKLAEFYSPEVRQKIDETLTLIEPSVIPSHLNLRWAALQMLEEHWPGPMPAAVIGCGDDWELKVGEERYAYIRQIVGRVLKKSPLVKRHEFTRKLDRVLCHPLLALPIFVLVMLLIFFFSFGQPGGLITGWFEVFLNEILPRAIAALLAAVQAGPVISSLVLDGIIAGVGGVLVFLPQLMLLFFFLALLEYSGYMARAAFLTDKLLSRFGLSGMSFIPMVLGFGCTVPAIMGCRALENKRERLLTMSVVPFMSCSARMPVYGLFAAAFFAADKWLVISSLYLLGIVVALGTAVILSPMIMKKERPLFLMEMPPYRKPVWHCVWRTLWMRTWDFISRAGSIILIASVIVWFLSNFNLRLQLVADTSTSILSQLGVLIAPLLAPLGLGQWQIAVALLTGFMAKEAVVSTLAVLLAGSGGLELALSALISPAAAYALLVFVLLYTPCVATLAAVRRESSSTGFTLRMIAYQLIVAWLVAFIAYQVGMLL